MTHIHAAIDGRGGEVTVAISGECDLATHDDLAAALVGALSRSDTVTADVSGVTFLDSSGLHALIEAYRAAAAGGKHLYLTGAVGVVAEVLSLTGIDDLLRRDTDA